MGTRTQARNNAGSPKGNTSFSLKVEDSRIFAAIPLNEHALVFLSPRIPFSPGAGLDRGRRGLPATGPDDPHHRLLRGGRTGPGGPAGPPEHGVYRHTAPFDWQPPGLPHRCRNR